VFEVRESNKIEGILRAVEFRPFMFVFSTKLNGNLYIYDRNQSAITRKLEIDPKAYASILDLSPITRYDFKTFPYLIARG
jgi:hypothetical protein